MCMCALVHLQHGCIHVHQYACRTACTRVHRYACRTVCACVHWYARSMDVHMCIGTPTERHVHMCIGMPAEYHVHRAACGSIACKHKRLRMTQMQPPQVCLKNAKLLETKERCLPTARRRAPELSGKKYTQSYKESKGL